MQGRFQTTLHRPINERLNNWIIETSKNAEFVMAVCTGTVLLATTGLIDGRKATTNKKDFTATIHHGPNVEWVKEARWVEDGKFLTSSGVSAGMDMALGAIAHMLDEETAEQVATFAEYTWHRDRDDDPFAAIHRLV